jgi:methionine sulfoxide reductase heme-binding subunit
MTIWQAVTWDVARAGGFMSYILLVLSVVAGLALSMQLQSPSRWPRLVNNELHNFLALLGTVFLAVHVLAVWVDPFVKFGWREVFIPFVSQYNAPWMAIGIVSMYLGIAVGISTLLRPRIGYKVWRYIHYTTFGVFVLATFHGIGTGTDTLTWWGLLIYLVSVVLVGAMFCWRMFAAVDKGKGKKAQVRPLSPVQHP